MRIHILGASGSGTTTLAASVAAALGWPHFDVDRYFWLPTDPPYTRKRPREERISMLQTDLLSRSSWTLSGSLVGWGEALVPMFDLVTFLRVPTAVRLERLRRREGPGPGAGPERDERWRERRRAFLEWAGRYEDPAFEGRSLRLHEEWLRGLPCAVLRIEGALSEQASLNRVLAAVGARREGAS